MAQLVVALRANADLPTEPHWSETDYARRDAVLAALGIQFKHKQRTNDDPNQ